jgi:hypothetical protein
VLFNYVIFGPNGDKVIRKWRKLHNEELNDLHSPLNIIRLTKSRRMRLAGRVTGMSERKGADRQYCLEKLRETDRLGIQPYMGG